MALNAQLRNFLFKDLVDRRTVGVVAGGTGAILNRRMTDFGVLQGRGKIRMAFETDVADGSIKKGLFG